MGKRKELVVLFIELCALLVGNDHFVCMKVFRDERIPIVAGAEGRNDLEELDESEATDDVEPPCMKELVR